MAFYIIISHRLYSVDPHYEHFVNTIARPHKIALIGTDGDDFQLDYLARRMVEGLVGQLPHEWGYQAVETLLEHLQGLSETGDATMTMMMDDSIIIRSNMVAYNVIPHELPPARLDPHPWNRSPGLDTHSLG